LVGIIITMSENNSSGGGRRLIRPRDGRMRAGVCAGLAAYFDIDVSLVRLLFGLFSFIYGLGILLYLAAWALLREEGEDQSIAGSFLSKARDR
jgi:phage shock protein PspC (stress-responsive transcriptional regulator)